MWDTDFFPTSPSGKVEAAEPDQTKDPCADCPGCCCCVTHHPECKILEHCSEGGVALGGFFPSFTSLFLLAIVPSRRQGRPCKRQPDTMYLTQNRSSYFDSCVWFYFYDVSRVHIILTQTWVWMKETGRPLLKCFTVEKTLNVAKSIAAKSNQ